MKWSRDGSVEKKQTNKKPDEALCRDAPDSLHSAAANRRLLNYLQEWYLSPDGNQQQQLNLELLKVVMGVQQGAESI